MDERRELDAESVGGELRDDQVASIQVAVPVAATINMRATNW